MSPSGLLDHSPLLPVRHEDRARNPNHYRLITIPRLGGTFQSLWLPQRSIDSKLDQTITDILLRVTMTIVALPIAIVTSYVLYQRRTASSNLPFWDKLIDGSGPGPREETIGTPP